MSPKYKLIYHDRAGRGELIRILFHAGKEEFEDHRVDAAEWQTLKVTIPSGELPVLETPDTKPGHPMTQSIAIARYLAMKFKFYPSNDLKIYQVERAVELQRDMFTEMVKIFVADPTKKEQAMKEYEGGRFILQFQELKRFLGESKGPFIAGSDLSLADFMLLAQMPTINFIMGCDIRERFPFVKEHFEAVIKKSPETACYVAAHK